VAAEGTTALRAWPSPDSRLKSTTASFFLSGFQAVGRSARTSEYFHCFTASIANATSIGWPEDRFHLA
jgi:hypothetical protein